VLAPFLLVVAALAFDPLAAGAQPPAGFQVQRVCAAAHPGYASCMALRLVPTSPSSTAPGANRVGQTEEPSAGGGAPAVTVKAPVRGFLTPADLHAAYSLPDQTASASTQTVAVIDAFDDPSAEADLGVYDEQFGLPSCTSANGCFRKVNQVGQPSPLPHKNGGWASEVSIDVQMAHAICQGCHILLVEASNESFADLGAAVDTAVNDGATEISNSYGAAERRSYLALADDYDHPGVVVAASSGDCGYLNEACPEERKGAEFPADSPDVVAVGGTSLRERDGTWTSRTWNEGGSGCSELFAAPSWQSAAPGFSATGCGEDRAIADVAAVGNPNTGVDVYDSTPEGAGEPTGWTVFGGTSVSSPIVAAEFALAGGSHGVAFPAATLYSHLGQSGALYDVVLGRNGSCGHLTICRAAVGYDGPTGVGSPTGLAAFSP
jgi:subtilase family serine protease